MIATNHMSLLSTWNVATVTKEMNVKFYLILINQNLNSRMEQVTTNTGQAQV